MEKTIKEKILRIISTYKYLIILILSGISFYVGYIGGFGHVWLENYSFNISAGLLCTILVAVLIDVTLNQQQQIILMKNRDIINTHLYRNISQQLRLFIEMYKAAADNEFLQKDIHHFLNNDFIKEIIYLDVNIKVAGYNPEISWAKYIQTEFGQFSNDLNKILDRYWSDMEQDIFLLIEKLLNSALQHTFEIIDDMIRFMQENEFNNGNIIGNLHMHDLIVEYMNVLSDLILLLNRRLPKGQKIEMVDYNFPIKYGRTQDLIVF